VPREIFASATTPLPDFSEPFLLPRARREAVRFDGAEAYFPERHSSLGLVLTKQLTESPLRLTFRARVDDCSTRREFVLLTVGGKTREGFALKVMPHLALIAELTDGTRIRVGDGVTRRGWHEYTVTLDATGATVACDGIGEATLDGPFLRKISFGGLYVDPVAHRTGCAFSVDTDSVQVTPAG
jgi:hypothetical protein